MQQPAKTWWKRARKAWRVSLAGRCVQFGLYLGFRAGFWLLGILPSTWAVPVGAALGRLTGVLHRRALGTARENLTAAGFPDAVAMADRVFRHFGITAVETARLTRELATTGPGVLEHWVEIESLDALRRALTAGRGAMLVLPHLGNWELLGLALAARGLRTQTIGRAQDNPWLDRWVRAFREQTGQRMMDKQGALRGALQALRRGELLLVLPDQYAGATGVPATLFGEVVSAPGILGALATRCDVPVWFGSCVRVGPARYRLRLQEIATPPHAGAADVTTRVFDALAAVIREHPDQWLWMHDLWRRRHPRTAAFLPPVPASAPPKRRERTWYRRIKRVLKNSGWWGQVQAVQYLLFRIAVAALQAIPAERVPRFAAGLAGVLIPLARRERRVFERNMDRVFGPTFTAPARRRALRRVYEAFLLMAWDTFVFPRRVRPQGFDRHFTLVGRDHVDAALARGKGVIFVLAHLGNWELASLHMAALGYPMVGIFAERTNPRIDDWLAALRTSTGARFLTREGALKHAIRALQANQALSLVIDLDAETGGVFVDFFGVPAATLQTAVALARRTGAPLIPFSSERIGPLRYRNTFHPPIDVADAPPGAEADRALLQQATRVLEGEIRRRPEQWAWMANRWKTRP